MTLMQEMVVKAIKQHNEERKDEWLIPYNRGMKFLSMAQDMKRGGHGEAHHIEYPNAYKDDYSVSRRVDDAYLRLRVRVEIKPKAEDYYNVHLYEVVLYSNGNIGVYFDGCEYITKEHMEEIRKSQEV